MSGATVDTSAGAMTLAEWGDLGDDEPGEFVDGRLVEEEEVGAEHDIVGAWLIWVLHTWLGDRAGFVGISHTRFGVSPTRGRIPDVYAYLPGRKPQRSGLVTVPPDIMIEIASRRPRDVRRDRTEKMRDYAAFGVRHYWIVDPANRIFQILELRADGRYEFAALAADGKIDPVPGCEGLSIDVDALWAEIDRLPENTEPEA